MNSLKVALIQQSCSPVRQANVDKTTTLIKAAAKQGAGLIVLPELHCTPYFCQTEDTACFDLAEAIPGPTTDHFGSVTKESGVVLVTSMFEKRAAGLYHNTAVVFDRDGSIAGTYRKMHIPDDPGYYEKFYFTPGDLGFTPIKTSVGSLGLLVCWDQWYPEAARLMAMAGADLLIYPTAIGFDLTDDKAEQQRQLDAWITVQRGHAIANGLPVVSVNRCGFEPSPDDPGSGIRFWGNSFVAGPQGEFLGRSKEEETTLLVDIDLAKGEEIRRIWPFMRDRRIDDYGDLVMRWREK
jgi:N-carbamoylputrescine amidase